MAQPQGKMRVWWGRLRRVFEPLIIKVLAAVLVSVGALVGSFFTGRATDADRDAPSKALVAEIDRVEPRDGGKGLGRDIRVSGTASPIPRGFVLRYAVRGKSYWYFADGSAVQVNDGAWEVEDSLGSADDATDNRGRFTLAIVLGKESDFQLWRASKSPDDDGIAAPPEDYALHVLADRVVRRTR